MATEPTSRKKQFKKDKELDEKGQPKRAASLEKQKTFNKVKTLIISLVIGCFSLLVVSQFNQLVSQFLQISVPIGEHHLQNGFMLLAWRFCYFLIILAIVIALSTWFVQG